MSQSPIRRIEDVHRVLDPTRPIVVLFSGGLDGTYLLKLLCDSGFTRVVALVVDVGGNPDPERLGRLTQRFGARLELVDARAEFARDFVAPAIRAQSRYLGMYPISSSLSRPLLARVGVAVAGRVGADAILHSAHASQNTLRRINESLRLLGFTGVFGTPFEANPVPRMTKIAELATTGLDFADRAISVDVNLWCREFESGTIDDPERFEVPENLYEWTRSKPGGRRDLVAVDFDRGTPVGLDGKELDLVGIVDTLNRVAGAHRIGRFAGLEHIVTGAKVLEAREMPAAQVLLTGYAHLLAATVDAETMREKAHLDQVWVKEAVEGRWYGRLRFAAQRFIDSVSEDVTGTVEFLLDDGALTLRSVRADSPLYLRDRAAWERTVGNARAEGGDVDAVLAPVRRGSFTDHIGQTSQ